LPRRVRGRDAEDEPAPGDRLGELGGNLDRRGQREARQVLRVLPGGADLLDQRRAPRPQRDLVALLRQQLRERGSVAPRAYDRDPLHAYSSSGRARTTQLRPPRLASYSAASAARTSASESLASSGNDATPTEIERQPPGCVWPFGNG